nr:hypothetical protein [Tanacetum cinerariifolium]
MDVAFDLVGKDNDSLVYGLDRRTNLWVYGRDILRDIFGHNSLHEIQTSAGTTVLGLVFRESSKNSSLRRNLSSRIFKASAVLPGGRVVDEERAGAAEAVLPGGRVVDEERAGQQNGAPGRQSTSEWFWVIFPLYCMRKLRKFCGFLHGRFLDEYLAEIISFLLKY